MCPPSDDDEIVPIPMDRETRERLVKLSQIVGDQPAAVASSLLRDVLREDLFHNDETSGTKH